MQENIENIELTCPNCKSSLGKIADSEFSKYIIRLTCPSCNNTYPCENFLPGYVPPVAEERHNVFDEERQQLAQDNRQTKEEATLKEEEAGLKKAAEQKEPETPATEETVNTQKPNAENSQPAKPATPLSTPTASKFPQVAQIHIHTPKGKEQTTKLEVRRNVIGRNQNYPTASGNNIRTMATILIDTEHKTMSREHLIIDVNIQREGNAIKYNYTASLYKQDVNDTLINNTKMKFGLSYFLKDKDQIIFPDGTKLTFINPAE